MNVLRYVVGLISLPIVGILIILGIVLAAILEHWKERDERQEWQKEIRRRELADFDVSATATAREDLARQARRR